MEDGMRTKFFWIGVSCCVMTSGLAIAQSNKLNATDKQFLKMAADANMMEAHLGQMAQAQASEETVRNFGKMLDQDHTKSYSQLQQVANKDGESIPKGINIRQDKSVEQLMHLKGPSFDRSFVRHEIQDHEKTIAEFKREAQRGEDPDLKSYAQQTLPVLKNHLRQAQDLANTQKRA
jgi:putative membrane protein